MLGRTEHRRTDQQQQTTDCQGNSCYSLRKQREHQVKIKNDIEDAIYYLLKGKDKKGLVVKTVNKEIGKGVFADQDFEPGSFLLEYDGELIKAAEGRHREKTYPLHLGSYIYFFQHKSRRFCLDGTFSKRKGRYINDGIGKEQNAVMKMIELDNKPHLAVFATRKILKGEEIRYDYGVTDLPWRSKTTYKAVKDCRVELERMSLKKIEDITGCKNQIDKLPKNDQMGTEVVENIPETSQDQHQKYEIFQCGIEEENENIDEGNDNERMLACSGRIQSNSEESVDNVKKDILSCVEQFLNSDLGKQCLTRASVYPKADHNNLPNGVEIMAQIALQYKASGNILNTNMEENQGKEADANQTRKEEYQSGPEVMEKNDEDLRENNQENVYIAVDKETETVVLPEDCEEIQENTQLTDEVDEMSVLYDKVPYNPSFKIPLPDYVEENPYNPNLLRLKFKVTENKHLLKYIPKRKINYKKTRSELDSKKNETDNVEMDLKEKTDIVETGSVEMDLKKKTDIVETGNVEIKLIEKTDNTETDIVETGNMEMDLKEKTDNMETGNVVMDLKEKTDNMETDIVETDNVEMNHKEKVYSTEKEIVETDNVETENEEIVSEDTESEKSDNVALDIVEHDMQLPSTSGIKPKDNVSDIDLHEFLCILVDEHIVSQAISRGVLIDEDEVETVPETLVGYKDLLSNAVLKKNARQYFTEDGWLTVESTIKMIESNIDSLENETVKETNISETIKKATGSAKVSKHTKAEVVVKKRQDCRPKRPCPFCGIFFRRLTKHLQTKVHKEELAVKQAMAARKQEKDNYFIEMKRLGYNKINIERIKESAKADLISEKKSKNKKFAICSFCKGTFTVPYISRHKRRCHVTEGTTMTPISIPISLIAETMLDPVFVENVLAKFKDDEAGNVCRTDEFIKSYGCHRFRKFKTRVDKKQEVRTSVMCEMRRLATLYLAFKEEAVKYNLCPDSVAELLNRKHFQILADAVDACSTSEDGSQKYGLKKSLGYLLKLAGKFRKGSMLTQDNDAEAKNAEVFLFLLKHNWIDMFDDAEYNCKKARQKELRRPKRLPNENDVRKLRDVTLSEIKRLTADEYKILTDSDFVRLRNLVVSRLTLFNARRGGEPGRLEITDWNDAKEGAWLDKNKIKATTDPLEKNILGRFYLTYQSGKNVSQLVPLLIPEDCWTAIKRLVDPGVRAAVGVHKDNIYVFPRVYSSLKHVSGWHCTESACRLAELDTVVTATVMRHRASTFYAALDLPNGDKEAFYRHMGHSEEINKNVYQCPMGIKEITSVGKFLEGIEVTEQPEEENIEMDDQQEYENKMQPSKSTTDDGHDKSQTDTKAQTEEFLKQLVDENVLDRALSGVDLIEEEEVEIIPEKLFPYHQIILSPSIQKKARCYFTKDAWTTAQNTFLMLKDLTKAKAKEKGQKRKYRESESDSDSDSDSDWSFLEDDTGSSEDEKKGKKCKSKRKKVTEKTAKPKESDQNKQTEMKTTKKKVERSYYQWNESDSKRVAHYFKQEINDTDSKKYPGAAAISKFLKTNPSILEGVPESQKTLKIKTKIFNERSKIRARLKKAMDKMVM